LFRLADHHLRKEGFFAYVCGLLEKEYVVDGIPYLLISHWWAETPERTEDVENYNEHASILKTSIVEYWDVTPQGKSIRVAPLNEESSTDSISIVEDEEEEEEVIMPVAVPSSFMPPTPYIR